MSDHPSFEETQLASGVDPRRSTTEGSVPTLVRGTVVGRYVVLASVGAGAMGVVYAAYDPELDRKLALKLLHAADPGVTGTGGYRRLLREAQAMAKLSHPNVIAVHDVGGHDGRVYLAMEFVEGTTLRRWCSAERRRWPELLAVLVAAGRGLAAAHEVGLVHRDFKPDNVMVGDDGRVRVMDFGLAQPTKAVAIVPSVDSVRGDGSSSRDDTRDDSIVGTPAYMAPEQHAGAEVGPAADQFSFCVALWEALYRQRPFAGGSAAELALRISDGRRRTPTPAAKVPAWLRRACERGLAAEPEQRFASMQALLATLERGQSRARARTIVAGIAVVVLGGAGVLAFAGYDRARRIDGCERAGASISEVWNDDRRAQVRDGIAGSDASYASTTAEKAMPWLDAHAKAWADARTHACMSTEIEHAWDEDLHDRAVWCLDDRRLDFDALLLELASGQRRVVQGAVQAAAGLDERLDACRDADLLSRSPAPEADQRASVQHVRAELARSSALQATAAYDEALAAARAAFVEAEATGWAPIIAESRLRVGKLLDRTAAYQDAERELESAYFEAAESGALAVAIAAADALVGTVGYHQQRHDDGLRWARHAEVLRTTLPADRLLLWVDAVAVVHAAKSDYQLARELLERALAIRIEALGPEHTYVAMTLNNIATIALDQGKYDEARALYERTLSIREELLGTDHPSIADTLENLANLNRIAAKYPEAQALSERALALRERALGPDHPDVAMSLTNLGIALTLQGDLETARRLHERALAIQEKTLGPGHLHVVASLGSLSELYLATGEHAKARSLAERALAIQHDVLGPDHPDTALGLSNLAAILIATGDYVQAKALDERALALLERTVGAENATVPPIVLDLARIALAEGRASEAGALAERVITLADVTMVAPEVLAEARSVSTRAAARR